LSFLAAAVSYKWGADLRFYPPLLVLLVAVAVLPVTWAAKNLGTGKRLIAAVAIFILFAAGACGRSRVSTGIVSSETASCSVFIVQTISVRQ
jgi:uncharacterized membrane protein